MDDRAPSKARRYASDRARQNEDRERAVNLSDQEIDDAIERLTGRWVLACLKTWGNGLVMAILGSAVFWLPPLWRAFLAWVTGRGGPD